MQDIAVIKPLLGVLNSYLLTTAEMAITCLARKLLAGRSGTITKELCSSMINLT